MQKWKAGSENVYLTQAEEVIKSHEVSHVLWAYMLPRIGSLQLIIFQLQFSIHE